MSKDKNLMNQEKFKTMIGGQALIEGIMMRGPEKDAVTVRKDGQIHVEVKPRVKAPEKSPKNWPLIRGVVGFFDAKINQASAEASKSCFV